MHHHNRAPATTDFSNAPSTTTSAASSSFTGDPTYPVFPNPNFISLFYLNLAYESAITNLDIDLYNRCYLPSNPLSYLKSRSSPLDSPFARRETWTSITIENPDYEIDKAPCKRQAAINVNCHFKSENGTAEGLQVYQDDFDQQQRCYCNKYPFFESVLGCQKCFEMHGGVEGYHWFPESYINAFADSYCGSSSPTKEFYVSVIAWKATVKEAAVPSTTAKDVLGTQTDVSLYYTAGAVRKSSKSGLSKKGTLWGRLVLISGVLAASMSI